MKKTFGVLILLCVVGCSKANTDRAGIESRPEVKAAPGIAASFALVATSAVSLSAAKDSKSKIIIEKSALEKEFLLQAVLSTNGDAPSFTSQKSRVVAFRKRDGKLYLLEATQGHTVTDDLPMTLLLAQFPILDETETQLVFDFNAGMSNIFVGADWYAQDLQGAKHDASYKAVTTRFSYIESAEMNDRNQLALRQIAQVGGEGGVEDNITVDVKYYLSPYSPSPDFEPVRSVNQDVAGFFSVAPVLKTDGSTLIRSSRFSGKSPIVYAMSANTPADFKQAVKDGILYWNTIFGEEKIKVVEAPAGVVAPDLNYNIVQWVPYDTAGFAFADAQMDPRSGEILHAQIYMTSAFASLGKARTRIALKRLGAPPKKSVIALAGFENSHLCEYDNVEALEASALALAAVAETGDEAKVLKVAQDYVREVVAHEVGHTLGLRHNFAGSVAANYPLSKRQEFYEAYLREGVTPKGVSSSSSVMDYLPFPESVMAGDQMARQQLSLEYDVKAIEILYKKKSYKADEVPMFCTDSQAASYVDCVRFDSGSSAVEYAQYQVDQAFEALPKSLLETFVLFSKSPAPGSDAVAVEKIPLSTDMYANGMLGGRRALYEMLSGRARFLKIRRSFPYVSNMNVEEVKKAEIGFVVTELEKAGGFEKVFGMVPADYTAQAFEKFVSLLNSGQYASGVGPNGTRFEFNQQETATMKAIARGFFDKLKLDLVKVDLAIIAGAKLVEHDVAYKLAPMYEKALTEYAMAIDEGKDLILEVEIPGTPVATAKFTGPDSMVGEVTTEKAPEATAAVATKRVVLTLPKFTYPLEVRLAAAVLLKADRCEAPDWGIAERVRSKNRFKEILSKSLGGNTMDKFKAEELPRPVVRWFIDNKKVNDALPVSGAF